MTTALSPSATASPTPSAAPSRWEWGLVAAWPILIALSVWPPAPFTGYLLPCLAAGLTPGCVWRLCGRRSTGVHRVALAAALLVYVVVARRGDWARVDVRAWLAAWPWMLGGVALVATQPVLGAWRWWMLLRAAGVSFKYGEALRLVLAGSFFNLAAPGATGGDLLRMGVLAGVDADTARAGRGARWGRAVTSVMLDRLLGTPALLTVVAVAFVVNADWVDAHAPFRSLRIVAWAAAAGSLAITAVLIAAAGPAHKVVSGWAARAAARGWTKTARMASGFTGVLAVYGGKWGAVGAGWGIGILSHACTVVASISFGVAAGVRDVPAALYFLLTPAGLSFNAIPLTPGGVGQGEWAFADLFEYAAPGLENGAAGLLVMLGLRVGLVLTGLAGGLVYMAGKHRPDDARTRLTGNAEP